MAKKKQGTNGPDIFNGTNASDEYHGLGGDDKIDGKNGNDNLYGDAGNDRILGANGNDKLYGGADDDKILGGTGNDKIYGQDGNDNLIGGADDDSVNGGAGDDILNGANGNDKIIGGLGLDTLTGGSGADHFYFKGAETGDFTLNLSDSITDFDGADGDRIRLRGINVNDGNTSTPVEGHYGVWQSGDLGWVVTYRIDGEYHDIGVGLQDPTGFVFSY
ncbi:MAG: hypothetical protein JWM58_2596 [Rhizobium sp.]|nr:hypothetical protein [Rhizobium sp.]